MRSKEYWRARAFQRETESYLRGAGLTSKMFQEYQTAAKEIRRAVNDFYGKYATKHGLTYEQAVKKLGRAEMQEWKAELGDYVKRIALEQDPAIKAQLTAQLDALSTNSRITRLNALEGQIDLILNDLYQQGVSQMREQFGESFQESYYRKTFDIQSRAGFIREFAKINPEMVENAVSYPWSGAMFSDRLWQNKQALIFNLRETITQGLIQGKSVPAMSKEISDKLGQSYKTAERLIRTENNHLHNEAEKSAYRAAGIKEYEFMATLDSRTCEVCGALDGKHFPISEAQPGVNFPPMHPNDRCTTIEYDPEEEMDWYNSGEPMPENMTYKEWAERQGIRGQSASEKTSDPGTPKKIKHLDKADKQSIMGELDGYEKELVGLDHEESVVITQSGAVYRTMGDTGSVNTGALGEKLHGASDIHNHPDSVTYYSFSANDAGFFVENQLQYSRAADSKFSYFMERTPETAFASQDEVAEAFDQIRLSDVRELAWDGKINIDVDEYHETMVRLSEKYHFKYGRSPRNGDKQG